ncbi:MAG: exodeoxyribonuclease VII small subunit [Rhodobacteraceae bacterium]|nr:exodeoxyribonuclease VII small subunit [Paracoccaceae bacterium]MCY4196064.1 exodeoxyribonuclease VII small subunit [Paracoccaceae bacterium]
MPPGENSGTTDIGSMSFEHALDELESIVAQLEQGDTPLEDTIRLYQRGNDLKLHCERTLKEAEERVEKITLDSQGNPTGTENFVIQE